ncbi:MAG TPA: YceH family protein [Blastocatellia bacterium]|nr:YceH family protein [Blastocatellia bacterium]
METILNEYEARVVGSLIEKQMTTPDYYPLTLNALTHACNQKNNRDPVVAYDEPTVQRALDSLREKKLAYVFTGSESRVPKYGHLFPKSYDLSPPEVAALCVLLLRGPQTVGEIRGRTGNLHQFESLAEVEVTLQGLMTREAGPLVARLPPPAGAKEPRYAHLLSGEVLLEELRAPASASETARTGAERITKLESELDALRREVDELRRQFGEFRKQFE